MEKLDREINIKRILTPTDSNNDGIIDSLVLTSSTISINVYLTQTIDDLGVYTDIETEEFEVIDLNGFWDTSNTGVGQGGIPYSPPIFNTALSGITDSSGSLIYTASTIGCLDSTAINYCSNCTVACTNCCVESWGGGNTSGQLGGTGLNPSTPVFQTEVIYIPFSRYDKSAFPITPEFCDGTTGWYNFYNPGLGNSLSCLLSDTYIDSVGQHNWGVEIGVTDIGATGSPSDIVYSKANEKCVASGGVKVVDMLPFPNPGFNKTSTDPIFKGVSFNSTWDASTSGSRWFACSRSIVDRTSVQNWKCAVSFWCIKPS